MSSYTNMPSHTPEVMFVLFLRGNEDAEGIELLLRRALRKWERGYHVAVYDVEKFPAIAEQYEIAATPTIVYDDLVTGSRSACVGATSLERIQKFLTARTQ